MSPRAKYSGRALQQKAEEAKRLKRKLETRKVELNRKESWERKDAARALREVAAEAKAARDFIADFEGGEFDDSERKATVKALSKLVKTVNDWAKHPEGHEPATAAALAFALLAAQFAKFAKKLGEAGKKA